MEEKRIQGQEMSEGTRFFSFKCRPATYFDLPIFLNASLETQGTCLLSMELQPGFVRLVDSKVEVFLTRNTFPAPCLCA